MFVLIYYKWHTQKVIIWNCSLGAIGPNTATCGDVGVCNFASQAVCLCVGK